MSMFNYIRAKYCSCRCYGIARRGPRKENVNEHASRQRARLMVAKIKCEKCGTTSGLLDVHHRDLNVMNNKTDNLQVLCRSCHLKIHRKVPVKKCSVKGCERNSRSNGMCARHNLQSWREKKK